MNTCDKCKYYRPLHGFGEVVMACWYTEDTGKGLSSDDDDDECNQFEEGER